MRSIVYYLQHNMALVTCLPKYRIYTMLVTLTGQLPFLALWAVRFTKFYQGNPYYIGIITMGTIRPHSKCSIHLNKVNNRPTTSILESCTDVILLYKIVSGTDWQYFNSNFSLLSLKYVIHIISIQILEQVCSDNFPCLHHNKLCSYYIRLSWRNRFC
jgi:hypothetical protein